MALVAAIDIGTTNTKGCIIRDDSVPLAFSSVPTPLPNLGTRGQREHDPILHWWKPFCRTFQDLIDKIPEARSDLAAIYVSGVWPTFLLVDQLGVPLNNALLYNDSRALLYQLSQDNTTDCVEGFEWAPRFRWWKATRPEQWERADRVHTTHSYLVSRLTGAYVIDYHTALATGSLYNEITGTWSDIVTAEVCPQGLTLPTVVGPTDIAGVLSRELCDQFGLTSPKVLVAAGTGDTFVSLISAGMAQAGDTGLYGGTVGHLVRLKSPVDLSVARFNRGRDEDRITWLGMLPNIGKQLEWCRNILQVEEDSQNLSWAELNTQLSDYLDLRSRTFDGQAEAPLYFEYVNDERIPPILRESQSLLNYLDLSHSRVDLVFSVVEYLGLRTKLFLANSSPAFAIEPLLLGGGVFRTEAVSRVMASVLGITCLVLEHAETSLGGALLLGHALGYFDLLEVQAQRRDRGSAFVPQQGLTERFEKRYDLFCKVRDRLKRADIHVH